MDSTPSSIKKCRIIHIYYSSWKIVEVIVCLTYPNYFLAVITNVLSYKVNADGIACCLTTPYPKNYEPPTKLSLLEVNRNNFGFIKKLGQGSFGEVWYGTWNNQMPVAIKKLLGNGNMNHARFLNEAELMHRLNHPNVVRILAVCTLPTNEPTYIISELMENGSLKQYMQKLNPVEIRMKNLVEMMKDVVGGMVHLEEQHYVHRDLRASNILVDSKNRLKVADFGLAHLLSDSDEYIGTLVDYNKVVFSDADVLIICLLETTLVYRTSLLTFTIATDQSHPRYVHAVPIALILVLSHKNYKQRWWLAVESNSGIQVHPVEKSRKG
ncbi:unnamed protein product [Schistosoma mattheei]|uniref:Uncharacterized protein n=1 Tax=Schistosoma mattheei TaxID=31246 RepID=A0A183P9H1_9TREM|nr:unnamed protein product [Schistosoma mattheei]